MTEDENSIIIISVNPTLITIKLIIFSSSILDHVVPNPNAKLKITPPVSMLLFLSMLEYIYDGHSIVYDPIYRVRKRE